ncbi:MAG: LD-carboxypeptidase [Myxococcales bacterium]|nr:LD-carboxypeptidase [Myxococcales bacterium]
MIIPPPLRPGARVHVVAPSSPFDVEAVRRGIAWLAQRHRVVHAPTLFTRRQGFLAGTDEERLAELQEALDAPDVAAVVTARGGYGALRLLDRLDWSAFLRAPRWLVGFSDATALHCEVAHRGHASLHAMNVAGLGDADDEARARWLGALEDPTAPRSWQDLSPLSGPGVAEGRLFGGNLTLLFTLAASGRLHVPEGCLLLLEDVTETSYRIDRMLTALSLGGHLQRAAGIVLGTFTDCSPGKYDVPVEVVLQDRLASLGIPVAGGLPVGHGAHNDPVPLGRAARLECGRPNGTSLRLLPEG